MLCFQAARRVIEPAGQLSMGLMLSSVASPMAIPMLVAPARLTKNPVLRAGIPIVKSKHLTFAQLSKGARVMVDSAVWDTPGAVREEDGQYYLMRATPVRGPTGVKLLPESDQDKGDDRALVAVATGYGGASYLRYGHYRGDCLLDIHGDDDPSTLVIVGPGGYVQARRYTRSFWRHFGGREYSFEETICFGYDGKEMTMELDA